MTLRRLLSTLALASVLALGVWIDLSGETAQAQSAALLPNGRQQFLDSNGSPVGGGNVFFYIPSTTTPKTTWQDSGEAVSNPNPVPLDSSGEALIYGSGQYRQVVKDALGNTVWDALTFSASNVTINGTVCTLGSACTLGGGGFKTVTSDYTVAPADCGVLRAGTGTSGFFTLTLPAVAGFASGCAVSVSNGDTGRGKALVGFPATVNALLWPGQEVTVVVSGAAWVAVNKPGRWVQTSTTPFKVDPASGSDAGDCLGTGSGACATLQHAVNLSLQQVLYNGATPTIDVLTGSTLAEGVACGSPIVGSPSVLTVVGDTATPTNISWTPPDFVPPSGGYAFEASGGCSADVEGFYFHSVGTPCVWLDAFGGSISVNHVNFGALTISTSTGCGYQVLVDNSGSYSVTGNDYTISGSPSGYHILMVGPAKVQWANTEFYIPSALTFTNFYLLSGSGANINYDATLLCKDHAGGTAGAGGCAAHSVGSPYNAVGNSNISTNSSVIPGNGAGVLSGGACVDNTCAAGTARVTYGTLAAAGVCNSGTAGSIVGITDSNTNTWGATVVSGGTDSVVSSCNGANWTVMGK